MKVDPAVEQAMNDTELRIGRNLRRIRESLDLSQQDIAQRLTDLGFRFHQTQVAKIERGERAVRVNEWIAIAEALGVMPMALMAGGLGTDDAVFEARLNFERMRINVDNVSAKLYDVGRDLEAALELYHEALEHYVRTANEAGEPVTGEAVELGKQWILKFQERPGTEEYAEDLEAAMAKAEALFTMQRREEAEES